MRERNTRIYRLCHWPIWIWVFFLAPGPLTFSLFARGFNRANLAWLAAVLSAPASPDCAAVARRRTPPLYPPLRRGQAQPPLPPRLLHLRLERRPQLRPAQPRRPAHRSRHRRLVYEADLHLRLRSRSAPSSFSSASLGKLPRVGPSTKTEGMERRYFYGSVWAVTAAQTLLLVLWKTLPRTHSADLIKLAAYVATLIFMGLAGPARQALPHPSHPPRRTHGLRLTQNNQFATLTNLRVPHSFAFCSSRKRGKAHRPWRASVRRGEPHRRWWTC